MGKVTGKEDGWKKLEPLAGCKGEPWNYKPDGPILQITVCYDKKFIRGISFQSENCDGVVGEPLVVGRIEGHKNQFTGKIERRSECDYHDTFFIRNLREEIAKLTFYKISKVDRKEMQRAHLLAKHALGYFVPHPNTDDGNLF